MGTQTLNKKTSDKIFIIIEFAEAFKMKKLKYDKE